MKKTPVSLHKLQLKKEKLSELTPQQMNAQVGGATLVDTNCDCNSQVCSTNCVTVPYTTGTGTFNSWVQCWSAASGCQ